MACISFRQASFKQGTAKPATRRAVRVMAVHQPNKPMTGFVAAAAAAVLLVSGITWVHPCTAFKTAHWRLDTCCKQRNVLLSLFARLSGSTVNLGPGYAILAQQLLFVMHA